MQKSLKIQNSHCKEKGSVFDCQKIERCRHRPKIKQTRRQIQIQIQTKIQRQIQRQGRKKRAKCFTVRTLTGAHIGRILHLPAFPSTEPFQNTKWFYQHVLMYSCIYSCSLYSTQPCQNTKWFYQYALLYSFSLYSTQLKIPIPHDPFQNTKWFYQHALMYSCSLYSTSIAMFLCPVIINFTMLHNLYNFQNSLKHDISRDGGPENLSSWVSLWQKQGKYKFSFCYRYHYCHEKNDNHSLWLV